MPMMQSRRRFLTTLSLAGAMSLVRAPRVLAADGRLETTTIRLAKNGEKNANICGAPLLVAEELLRAEGFSDIRYVDLRAGSPLTGPAVARGTVDLAMAYTSGFLSEIDAGGPIRLLAGVMVGCVEVFANEGIRGIADLKGKSAVGNKFWDQRRTCC